MLGYIWGQKNSRSKEGSSISLYRVGVCRNRNWVIKVAGPWPATVQGSRF